MIGREDREMPDWARSLLEFEESMAGKSSARWAKTNGLELTGLAILLSATLALFGSGPFPNGLFDMASIAIEGGEVNGRFLPQAGAVNYYLYATITAVFLFIAYWVSIASLMKWTFGKDLGAAFLGLATSWIALIAIRYVSHFVLVEADWEVIWANRVLALAGPSMTSQMTQSHGSVVDCINTCYGINQLSLIHI